jgi:uncharacterized protein (TIGR01244 family)
MTLRKLDEAMFVAGQIHAGDIPVLKAGGIAMIVNNRPDSEEPDQPAGDEIEAAARAAGIGYRSVPIAGGFSGEQVQAMGEALDAAEGPVLAFCRSGTRSTYLWALARSQQGDAAEELMRKAASAGYDLTPIAPDLQR